MLHVLLTGKSIWEVITYLLSIAVVVFVSSPIHECAHAFVAVKLGDPTPKYNGRVTLNPFAHMDYIGALMILLFGFGWFKPVPVNTRYFSNPKRDMALTALAGPVSNLLIAFVFFVINKLLAHLPAVAFLYYLSLLCYYIVLINIGLAVFNLIPIPPLDGSRLISAVLSDRSYYRLMQYERYFFIIILVLLATNVLDIPLNFLQNLILRFFNLITFWL